MRGPDEAARGRQRRAHDLVGAERGRGDADADDVADRVERPDLVEVHLVGGTPWIIALGAREPPEGVERPPRGPSASPAASTISRTSRQLRCTCSCGATTSTCVAPMPWRSTRVSSSSRPSTPVAASASRTAATSAPASSSAASSMSPAAPPTQSMYRITVRRLRPRAMRAAIVPAPKPSSMFTTESAAAHELSIASRAATPLNAVP